MKTPKHELRLKLVPKSKGAMAVGASASAAGQGRRLESPTHIATERPGDAALTEMASLLGRRAAFMHRKGLGYGHAGLAAMLPLVVAIVAAIILGFLALEGR